MRTVLISDESNKSTLKRWSKTLHQLSKDLRICSFRDIETISKDQLPDLLIIDLCKISADDQQKLNQFVTSDNTVRLGHLDQKNQRAKTLVPLRLDAYVDLSSDAIEAILQGWAKLAKERSTNHARPEIGQRRNLVLEHIIALNHHQNSGETDYLNKALSVALKLINSAYGYIFLYDEMTKTFTLSSWSAEVMPNCTIEDTNTCFELDKTGYWGEAVRQRKAVILNDFSKYHPNKRGYPEGHVEIHRFLSCPIFHEGKIVAVVGAANKTNTYTQEDIDDINLFMQAVWATILRRRYEFENAKLLNAINKTPVSIVITDLEGNIEYVNPYFTERTGYRFDEVRGTNPRFLKSGNQDKAFYKELWETIKSGKTWVGELQNAAKDGSLFWESVTITPLMNQMGPAHFIAVKKDITFEKERKAEIERSERLLNATQSLAETGGWEYDPLTRSMYWTDAMFDIHGYDKNNQDFDHINESLKCYPEKTQIAVLKAFERCVHEGAPYDLTLPFRDLQGNSKWIRTKTYAAKDNKGKVIKVIGSFKDVTIEETARIEAEEREERIREQERFLQNIIQSSNVGIGLTDIDGKFTFANSTLLRLLMTTLDDLKQLDFYQLAYPEDIRDEATLIKNILDADIQGYRKEKRLKKGDGTYFWSDLSVNARRNKNGEIIGLISSIIDITEKKLNELALRESESKNRYLIEGLNTVLWTSDAQGNVNFINHYGTRFFGNTAKRILSEGWISLLHPEDQERSQQLWLEALENGTEYENTFRILIGDGYRWITVSASRLIGSNDEELAWIGIVHDVHQEILAKKELEKREARFRGVISAFEDIVFTLDAEGRHTGVFGEWIKKYKLNAEDLIGKTQGEVIGKDAARRHIEALEKAKNGKRADYEWTLEDESGTRRFITYLTPMKAEEGEEISFLGVGREITAEWNQHQKILENSKQLKALSDFSVKMLQLEKAQEIYDFVATFIHQIIDYQGYIIVSHLMSDETSFEIKSVAGIQDRLSTVLKVIGRHPVGMKGKINPSLIKQMRDGAMVDLPMNVHQMTDQKFANYFGREILDQLGIDRYKSILIYDGDKPLASVSLALPERHKKIDPDLISSLMNQAAMALSRTYAFNRTKSNEERLLNAQEIGAFGDWTYELEHDRYIFSDKGCTMLGLNAPDALDNEHLFKMIHEDDRTMVEREHGKLFKGEKIRLEHRVVVKNQIKWFSVISAPSLDQNGKLTAVKGTIHDITDSKMAELNVIESENRFRALIEHNTSEIILVKDEQHRIAYLSPSISRILGYDNSEWLGRSSIDLIHPSEQAVYIELFEQVRHHQRDQAELKLRLRHKDGTYRWMVKTISDQRSIPGVGQFVENIKDIDKEERNAEALRQSYLRYELASKASSDIIYDYDITKGWIDFSESYQMALGYDEVSFPITRWENYIHEEDRDEILKDLGFTLMESKNREWGATYRYLHQDGSYRWMDERASIIRDIDGVAVRMIGAMIDRTERYEYERSIEEQNAKLRDIAWMQSHLVRAPLANLIALVRMTQDFELASTERNEIDEKVIDAANKLDDMIRNIVKNAERLDIKNPNYEQYRFQKQSGHEITLHSAILELAPKAYFISEISGIITFVNKALEEILSVKRENIVGSDYSQFILDEDSETNNLVEMRVKESNRQPYEVEVRLKRSATNAFWARIVGQPYLTQTGVFGGYFYTVKDISDEHNTTLMIQEKSNSLARINEELKNFTYIISHDLKAPVNSLKSLMDLLLDNPPALNSEQKEYIERATQSADQIKKMIEALLAYSRNGNIIEPRETVVFGEVIDHVKSALHKIIKEENAIILVDHPEKQLNIFPSQFERILLNLIQNAIKFRGEKSPIINVRVAEMPSFWKVEVEDNGIGITKNALPHIFKLFYHKNVKQPEESHGIGLSVVKRLVEQHEGSIQVKSKVGKGTNFIFTVLKVQTTLQNEHPNY